MEDILDFLSKYVYLILIGLRLLEKGLTALKVKLEAKVKEEEASKTE